MKKILIFAVIAVILTLSVMSCRYQPPEEEGYSSPPSIMEKSFWAQDNRTETFYKVNARCMAWNSRCEVWVEKGKGIKESQAEAVADEYKDKIYPRLMESLGWYYVFSDVGKKYTMEVADLFGDANGRLTILLLDIQDGFVDIDTDPYIAGYFYALDFFDDAFVQTQAGAPRSNECDMIYMDIYPSIVGSENFYETLAHEMQHMMNIITTFLVRVDTNDKIYPMDLWIDEGLSSAAEYLYSGKVSQNRVDWYNHDNTGYISKGDNFYLWDNHKAVPRSILNDYATVNLFFQWLRVHYGTDVYGDILISMHSDFNAVSSTTKINQAWANLFSDWHIANYLQHPSNKYGYKDDPVLKTVKAHYFKETGTSFGLYPGEAVYSYSQNQKTLPTFSSSSTVWYYGLGAGSVNNAYSPAGGALLSFNRDTNQNGSSVSATVTGSTPPPIANININSRSAISSGVSSYRIDAGDLQRQRGFENSATDALISGVMRSSPVSARGVISADMNGTLPLNREVKLVRNER
ncbi:MAG: hypothetical protein FWB95_03070 [Treponema sp.]|nr:hypothetical protein [Treponema sp.]